MKQTTNERPRSPQKYGHAHRVIPIRRRIWQRVLLRWLIVLAIGGALVLLCIISEPFYQTTRNRQIGMGMTLLLYAVILWQSRVFKVTFSKEWMGTIRSREVVKYTRMTKGPMVRDVNGMPPLSTKCVWTVETDDGYIEKLGFDTEEIWEGYFEIGERVRFYKNAKILVKAHPPHDDENLMCPLCGVMVMEPVCKKCGVNFVESSK